MSKRRVVIQPGQIFGFLEVISEEGQDKFSNYLWRCVCKNCGKEKTIRAAHLVSGNSRSCGCLMRTSSYVKKEEDAVPSTETVS